MAPKDVRMPKWDADVTVTGKRAGASVSWHVPEEAPVALVYNGLNHAVMLASPADLGDFALGFSVTEGIVKRPDDIRTIEVFEKDQGIDLMITLADAPFERFKLKHSRRAMTGRTGCGLCGIDSMEELFQTVRPVAEMPAALDEAVVRKAVCAFDGLQPLKKLNRSVHGAAWVTLAGDITLVREDVGRHNALDKLLGALMRDGTDMTAGFVLVSSRASYEMAQKCVAVGAPALVCLSAPTAFAIRLAQEARLTLANWSTDGLVSF
ncbi:FdhD protein [Kordiimonas lacus]|uniref:Sulfur carrier protein FdhD n=2 Tax=Kordiimonas lacus TaxID=637679 RepID=A0A1G7BE53_9PROT|nr:FdhD protein [Kordiimonas lacus]